jgi:predicted flap endonuclease-1-like 5' DNA nuclease
MYLISKIVLCLLLAFAFGFGLAWLLWHLTTQRREDETNAMWQRRFGDLQRERDTTVAKIRHELEDQRQQIPTLETSLRERSDLIAQLEADLIEWREKMPELQTRLDHSETEKDRLHKDNARLQERLAAVEAQQRTANTDDSKQREALEDWQRKYEASVAEVRKAEAKVQESEQTARDIAEELDASLVAQKASATEALAERDKRISELMEQLEQARQHSAGPPPKPKGVAPEGLYTSLPDHHTADDLKKIRGVGPVLEKTLNELGIYFFRQIAEFNDDHIDWVADHINTFGGRIKRDQWVEQAASLASLRD